MNSEEFHDSKEESNFSDSENNYPATPKTLASDKNDASSLKDQIIMEDKEDTISETASSNYDEESKVSQATNLNDSLEINESKNDNSLPDETLEIQQDVLEESSEDDASLMPSVLNEEEVSKAYTTNNNLVHGENTNDEHQEKTETAELELELPKRSLIQNSIRVGLEDSNKTLKNIKSSNIEDKRVESTNFLLQSRASEINEVFHKKDSKVQESINNGTQSVQKTFNDIKNTVGGFGDMFGYKIDWDFWTKVVSNYEETVLNDSNKLNEAITKGIPKEFRGIIWQLVAKAKNLQLEELYLHLKSEPSVHEKAIKRDLTRTSFFTSVEQVGKGEELFNVIKAYSLFDPDVGYTQGMIFITVPLVMNMTDSECFCLLVTIMKEYNLRSLFSPEMKGLHLLLYEFDCLLEMYSPKLYNHLVKQGIKSSMYASQWFLTFFAYKFPLDIVLRIYDVIITSGMESILKFAINLMIKNESNLLALKFDKLLEFLKDKLFNYYVNDEYVKSPEECNKRESRTASVSRRFSLLGKRASNSLSGGNKTTDYNGYYKLDQLVCDSMKINVLPSDLKRFENEFEAIYEAESSKIEEIESLQVANGNLRHEIKNLEQEYTALNRDHVDTVQKMIDLKVLLPEILSENKDLEATIEGLKHELSELESKIAEVQKQEVNDGETGSNSALPSSIEDNIHELLSINAEQTERYANLEDEYETLLEEERKLDIELEELKSSKKWIFGWR